MNASIIQDILFADILGGMVSTVVNEAGETILGLTDFGSLILDGDDVVYGEAA